MKAGKERCNLLVSLEKFIKIVPGYDKNLKKEKRYIKQLLIKIPAYCYQDKTLAISPTGGYYSLLLALHWLSLCNAPACKQVI